MKTLIGLFVVVLYFLLYFQGSFGLERHVAVFLSKLFDNFLLVVSTQLVALKVGSLGEGFATGSAGMAEPLDVRLSVAPQVEPVVMKCFMDD